MGNFRSLTDQLNLGAFLNPTYFINGSMDEARIQSGVASSNWIWATYLNMANPSSFAGYSSLDFGPPVLVQDIAPLTQTVEAYSGLGTVSYSVVVSGAAPIAYQWYEDGTSISGATNSIYTFTAQAGTNTYYVSITNVDTASEAGGVALHSSRATVIGTPVLATTNYGYRMRFSFPGYTGSQTLTNFPALVQFSNGRMDFRIRSSRLPAAAICVSLTQPA